MCKIYIFLILCLPVCAAFAQSDTATAPKTIIKLSATSLVESVMGVQMAVEQMLTPKFALQGEVGLQLKSPWYPQPMLRSLYGTRLHFEARFYYNKWTPQRRNNSYCALELFGQYQYIGDTFEGKYLQNGVIVRKNYERTFNSLHYGANFITAFQHRIGRRVTMDWGAGLGVVELESFGVQQPTESIGTELYHNKVFTIFRTALVPTEVNDKGFYLNALFFLKVGYVLQ
jgi:hypothetical protein